MTNTKESTLRDSFPHSNWSIPHAITPAYDRAPAEISPIWPGICNPHAALHVHKNTAYHSVRFTNWLQICWKICWFFHAITTTQPTRSESPTGNGLRRNSWKSLSKWWKSKRQWAIESKHTLLMACLLNNDTKDMYLSGMRMTIWRFAYQ